MEVSKERSRVIIGGSGSGKSVILEHIIEIMKPDSSSVFIEDVDIACLKGNRLCEGRKRFGMVLQTAALFDAMSVRENVGFALWRQQGMKPEDIKEIEIEKLKMAGLAGDEDLMPSEHSGAK